MAETATVQIQMPEMGESVTEGVVLEWHVAEGDFVREGDTVVEVSTDKVDAEVPAPADGTITKLLVAVDEEVAVGAPLAEMEPGGGDGTGEGSGRSAAGPVAAAPPPAKSLEESRPRHPQTSGEAPAAIATAPAAGAEAPRDGGVRATPVARRVAEELGVDVRALVGSGPGAKVTKEDVLAAANGEVAAVAPVAPAPPGEGEAKQLRGPAAALEQLERPPPPRRWQRRAHPPW